MINNMALALYVALVWLAYDGIRHYWPRLNKIENWGAEDVLGAVIAAGFAMTAIGNGAFWSLHFLAEGMGWAVIQDWTHSNGQLANILTRYVPYILVVCGHLGAAWVYGVKGVEHPRYYVVRTLIVATIAFCALQYITL